MIRWYLTVEGPDSAPLTRDRWRLVLNVAHGNDETVVVIDRFWRRRFAVRAMYAAEGALRELVPCEWVNGQGWVVE